MAFRCRIVCLPFHRFARSLNKDTKNDVCVCIHLQPGDRGNVSFILDKTLMADQNAESPAKLKQNKRDNKIK